LCLCETAGQRGEPETTGLRGYVRIYSSDQCPRQDSNLRSRLRRPILFTASTWQNAPFPSGWGAYGGSAGYELLDQDAATSFDHRQGRGAPIVVSSVVEYSCWCCEQSAARRCRPAGRSREEAEAGPWVTRRISRFAFDRGVPGRPRALIGQAASVPGSMKASRWSPKSAMISRRPPRAST